MYTLILTNTDLIYFFCLLGVAYTSWSLGIRTGAQRAVEYMQDNNLITLEEETEEIP